MSFNTINTSKNTHNNVVYNQKSEGPQPKKENLCYIGNWVKSEEGPGKIKSLTIGFFDLEKHGKEKYTQLYNAGMISYVQFKNDNKEDDKENNNKVLHVYLDPRWYRALTTNLITIVRDNKVLLKDKNFKIISID